MKARVALYAGSEKMAKDFAKGAGQGISIDRDAPRVPPSTLAFVDGAHKRREEVLRSLAEQGAFTVLVVKEGAGEAEAFAQGDRGDAPWDDVLLLPLRAAELRSKIMHFGHLAHLSEVAAANTTLKSLIGKVEEDLRLARSLQKRFIPEKFSVPGFKIHHKYLSGLKSGGDYFDVFEFDDRTHVGVFLSDSTGYGLSSALLSVMLRMAFRFGKGSPESPSRTLARIFDEVKTMMREGEELSIFYGLINKRTLEMRFAAAGDLRLYVGGEALLKATPGLRRPDRFRGEDRDMVLVPGSRMALLTDGFAEALGGDAAVARTLRERAGEDPVEVVNDCAYAAKRALASHDEMPPQDCSLLVFDVEKTGMRLAKG